MNNSLNRLKYYITNDPHLRFYVNASDKPPFREWEKVDPENVNIEEVKAFIVTYPSGEVLDQFLCGPPFPDDVHFMEGPVYQDGEAGFSKKMVKNDWVTVVHGKSASHPDKKGYYSTTLTNKTNQKIRIYKFAPLNKLFGLFYPSEPKPGYYSPLQFKEWFRVPDGDGWISPKEQAIDPDNWGTGKGIWAYFIENENGERFIATASTNGK